MVLQHGVSAPVWGRAEPGERVTVSFAGQSKQATSDARGLWHAKLDAMPANAKPQTMTLKGAGDAVELKGVLVGDVWLFSGDSIGLGYYHGRFQKRSRMGVYYDIRPFIKEDQAAGGPPIIRTFATAPRGKDRHARHVQYRFDTDGNAKWTAYDPATWSGFPAIPYFFGRQYFKRVKVPVGLLEIGLDDLASMTPPEGFQATAAMRELANTVGAWNPTSPTGRTAHLKTLSDVKKWLASTHRSLNAGSTELDDFSQAPRLPGPPPRAVAPTTYYNGSIHPVAPFAIRGLILKTLDKNQYDKHYSDKAEALIRGLRIVMNSPKAPAAFFQYRPPMYWEERAVEDQSVWMRFRQRQRGVSKTPATTVLPAHDYVNDPRDPRNWAQRASQWAIATVENQPIRSGPVYDSHKVNARSVTVRFKQVDRGLIVGDKKMGELVKPATDTPLGGFELAGADGRWRPATAKIDGKSVIVTSKDLAKPVTVRYAWAPRPKQANLYNQAGFPALPFNTHP
jgi:sialate O-acetylesterase